MLRLRRRVSKLAVLELLEPRWLMAVHNTSFDVTGLTRLRSDPVYSAITGAGVTVAVLDTGVYGQNPDLSNQVLAFYNAVESAVPTSASAAPASAAVDTQGHGTHVSGTVASTDPNIGVAYGAKLVDVKVIADSGESQLGGDPLLRGLQFVERFSDTFNIKVVNMSLGESSSNGGLNLNSVPAADDIAREIHVLESLGITVVSASGNSYANNPTPGASYPAVVSTISVASTWSSTGSASDFGGYAYGTPYDSWAAYEQSAAADRFSATSQRSTLSNQVAAPGVDIYSDWNNSSSDNSGQDLLHNTISGTSMATPFVSGLVALIQNAAKTFGGRYITSTSQVLSLIKASADRIVDSNVADNGRVQISNGALVSSTAYNLPETSLTYYRVDVYKAIQMVQSMFSGPISTADTDNTAATATVLPDLTGVRSFNESGTIGTDGLNQVGNNDIDLYKVVLSSPGNLNLSLTQPAGGTAFVATIRLFDSNGNLLSSADGSSGAGYPTLNSASPLAAGTYYVGVSSVGNNAYNITNGSGAANGSSGGDYTLNVSLNNPDPNGVAAGASNVDLSSPNTTLSGSISANQFLGILGSDPAPDGSATRVSVPNGDVDMFKVVAPDSGVLVVQTDTSTYAPGQGADTYVRVFDANLNQVAFNDDANVSTTDSYVQASVTIGATYYVAVTNYANRSFDPVNPYGRVAGSTATAQDYTLYLNFDNGDTNGTALLATSANVGVPVAATIGSDNGVALSGANAGFKDVDWYAYTIPGSGLLDLAADSTTTGFSANLGLWTLSSDGSSITRIGETNGGHLISSVASGQIVYVSVTGKGNGNFNWYAVASGSGGQTGSYTLSSTLRSASDLATLSNNSINNGTPTPISAGDVVSGNLGMDGGLIVGPTDIDLYKFTPTTSGRYDIRTDTSQEGSADTVLRLFDSSGNPIAVNDNASSATTASYLRATLSAGQTYYIGISGAGAGSTAYDARTGANAQAGSTGTYQLSLQAAVGPAASVAAGPVVQAPINSGLVVTATFTISLDFAPTSALTIDYGTADGSAVAGQDYTATSGTLTFQPGQMSQTVTVPILYNASRSTDVVYYLNLTGSSANATIAASQATATITHQPIFTYPFSTRGVASYTDTAGRLIRLRLSGPGTGSVSVVGTNASSVHLTVDGSTERSRLAISVAGGGVTVINGLQINGSLYSLSAPGVELQGDMNVTGSLVSLRLAGASGGHRVSVSGTGLPASWSLGGVSDLSLNVAQGVRYLLANYWNNSTGAGETITTPNIGVLRTAGNFSASLVTGSLYSAAIGGAIVEGVWSVSGSVRSIRAKSIEAGWSGNFAGDLAALSTTGVFAGSLVSRSAAAIRIGGDMSGSLRLTGEAALMGTTPDLGSLVVYGSMSHAEVRSAGNIRAVSVAAMLNSTIFAGVSDAISGLPTATDFTGAASILSFSVRGKTGLSSAFANSSVAAATLGRVLVRQVQTANNGQPFGFASHALSSFTRYEPAHHTTRWTSRQDPALLSNDGDFNVRLG